MNGTLSPERTPDVEGWKKTLEALTSAHQACIGNQNDAIKVKAYETAWKKAFAEATTTDKMGELIHHVPTVEEKKELQAKWDKLSEEEEARLAGTHNLEALYHAYDNAPFDEHRDVALQKLVEEITDKKDAKHFHNISNPESDLSHALEKKFPKLFEDKMNEQIEDQEAEEKTNTFIQQIRKKLGL